MTIYKRRWWNETGKLSIVRKKIQLSSWKKSYTQNVALRFWRRKINKACTPWREAPCLTLDVESCWHSSAPCPCLRLLLCPNLHLFWFLWHFCLNFGPDEGRTFWAWLANRGMEMSPTTQSCKLPWFMLSECSPPSGILVIRGMHLPEPSVWPQAPSLTCGA